LLALHLWPGLAGERIHQVVVLHGDLPLVLRCCFICRAHRQHRSGPATGGPRHFFTFRAGRLGEHFGEAPGGMAAQLASAPKRPVDGSFAARWDSSPRHQQNCRCCETCCRQPALIPTDLAAIAEA